MMRKLFYLGQKRLERIRPYFPLSRGVAGGDGSPTVSGIVSAIKHGLQGRDAPSQPGPYKTLYNRFVRWSHMDGLNNLFLKLAKASEDSLRTNSTRLKARHPAACPLKKGLFPGRTEGGLNSRLHAVCNETGKLVASLLNAGKISGHRGAGVLLERLPKASRLTAGKGCNWLRRGPLERNTTPCSPSKAKRGHPHLN